MDAYPIQLRLRLIIKEVNFYTTMWNIKLLLLFFLILAGCVKAPITGRSQLIIVSESEEIAMGDLAQKIIDLISKDVVINSMPTTPGSPERRCPNIRKLKKAISYTKQYPLEKGLQETFTWYDANVFSGQDVSAVASSDIIKFGMRAGGHDGWDYGDDQYDIFNNSNIEYFLTCACRSHKK